MKLLLFLLLTTSLLAEPVRVTYVSTKLTSINFTDVNYLINHAQRYFKPLHMVVRMRQIYIDKTLCPNGEGSERTKEIYCLDLYAERHFKRKKTIIYNFLTPGWADKYRHYFGGVALATCTNTILNTADIDMYGSYENSLDASADFSVHEIFHAMCATHVYGVPNIMSPYLWRKWVQDDGLLPVHEITKRQVKRWYVKVRRI